MKVSTLTNKQTNKLDTTLSYKSERVNDNSSACRNFRTWVQVLAIRVVEFSKGDTKLERFLPKNQHNQRINGELSKSAKI